MDDRRNQGGGRFVILRHEMPPGAERGSHWDLMLENRGVLLTWELPKLEFDTLPASFEQLGIRRLADHRIDYLEYEGQISSDRGTVRRVDNGIYLLSDGPFGVFVKVEATGTFFQIEFSVPSAIFQQIDEPTSNAGELFQFLDL